MGGGGGRERDCCVYLPFLVVLSYIVHCILVKHFVLPKSRWSRNFPLSLLLDCLKKDHF